MSPEIDLSFWVPPPTLVVAISADPDPVASEGTSTITVTVTVGGVPISTATVVVSTTCGSLYPLSGTTDVNGVFTSTFTAPYSETGTTCTITATASKTGYTSGSNNYVITVSAAPPSIKRVLREGIYNSRLAARRLK